MASFGNTFQDTALARVSDLANNVERGGLNFLANGPLNTTVNPYDPSKDINRAWSKNNLSFSGTDCTVVVNYNQHMIILGNVETMTYSIHRDKAPVRTLGRVYPKDYVRGGRTIAGSMVFIQFDEHPLYSLFQFFNKRADKTHRYSSPLADDLPAFDMLLIFNNEYGAQSVIRLYGVDIMEEGSVYSINDMYSENVMQFVCKDMDPMVSAGEEDSWKRLLYQKMVEGKIIDSHFASMLKYRAKIELRISQIDQEINKEAEDGRGPLWNNIATDKVNKRKDARKAADKLRRDRDVLVTELNNVDQTIANYEKTKMSWDLNSGLEPANNYQKSVVTRNDANTTDKTSSVPRTGSENPRPKTYGAQSSNRGFGADKQSRKNTDARYNGQRG